ncbi:MAG: hypothetical protein IT442_02120 [Phycisphaeraceae bacterium]|nr:hypothetical protein [Phycisphaeraceae bacterium]
MHPEAPRAEEVKEREGTYHAFKGRGWSARIDWIICRGALVPVAAEIDRWQLEGRYPSDHYPVVAELAWGDAGMS